MFCHRHHHCHHVSVIVIVIIIVVVVVVVAIIIRDFKIQRRGRQRECQKNNWFNKQDNKFARASRFFVHFFPVFARLRRENA